MNPHTVATLDTQPKCLIITLLCNYLLQLGISPNYVAVSIYFSTSNQASWLLRFVNLWLTLRFMIHRIDWQVEIYEVGGYVGGGRMSDFFVFIYFLIWVAIWLYKTFSVSFLTINKNYILKVKCIYFYTWS